MDPRMAAHTEFMAMNNDEILTVRGVSVAYGESKVLFDADLSVKLGQVVSCVGRNGAGKTTLLKSIGGFLKPTSGSIVFNQIDLIGKMPYDIARMGLKYIPQDKKVFSDLTVRENLELGSYATKDYDWDQVTRLFPKLKSLMDRKAGYLSGGERQMLMIGRAILGHPKVLLVDEPTEGLAPSIVEQLKNVFKELSKRTALVIVEQNLSLVCTISDKVYAIKEGRIITEISDEESIRSNICERYL
ncbi:MAG TPA: ABC transporter ATP-binding protein [Thermodesulfobacteriota bacterium]|nr:ABC transporter ATP-binding protein [Thermodesulfobacteriota bacterium]